MPKGFLDPDIIIGRENAPQLVTIYLSTTCSHCAAFMREVLPDIDKNLIQTGRLRLRIRELPTTPVATSAAGFLIARCAGRSRYWDVVQALLQHQDEVLAAPSPRAAAEREARLAGIDQDALEGCLSDTTAVDALNLRRQNALEAGVDGTPTFDFASHRLTAGTRLAGQAYGGGELTYRQFLAALEHFANH